ncbi:MAG: hypothetical protein GX803_07620 [Lentisphaerae bacterium]|jgi:hypothetical protein|nr:hypothetical protein [Lentisphaerota bacterium]
MIVKLILLLLTPLSADLSGDEANYVSKARYLCKYGRFPPVQAVEEGEIRYSDFRPPGYSAFVAVLISRGETTQELRQRVSIVQYILDLLVTTCVLFATFRFSSVNSFRTVAALVLGAQPWTSAYIVSIYPDTLTMFLAVTGLLFLTLSGSCRKTGVRSAIILFGSLLLSLSLLVRPEMIALACIMLGVVGVLALGAFSWRAWLLYAALAGASFLFAVSLNVAYHWQTEHRVRMVGDLRHATPGFRQWVGTWIGPQHWKEELLFSRMTNETINELYAKRLSNRVFTNPAELDTFTDIARNVQVRGYMTIEDDRRFEEMALARIAASPWSYYVWGRLFNSCHLWVNLSNATHVLHGLARCPRVVSRCLTASLLLFKLVLLLFAAGGGMAACRGWRRLTQSWHGRVVLAGAIFVLLRTTMLGFAFNTAEHRYALVAWPFVLALALYGLARLCPSLETPACRSTKASR